MSNDTVVATGDFNAGGLFEAQTSYEAVYRRPSDPGALQEGISQGISLTDCEGSPEAPGAPHFGWVRESCRAQIDNHLRRGRRVLIKVELVRPPGKAPRAYYRRWRTYNAGLRVSQEYYLGRAQWIVGLPRNRAVSVGEVAKPKSRVSDCSEVSVDEEVDGEVSEAEAEIFTTQDR